MEARNPPSISVIVRSLLTTSLVLPVPAPGTSKVMESLSTPDWASVHVYGNHGVSATNPGLIARAGIGERGTLPLSVKQQGIIARTDTNPPVCRPPLSIGARPWCQSGLRAFLGQGSDCDVV